MSTAYHPQTNGQTKRVNQALEQYLRCFIEHHQKDDWISFLSTVEFAYNNTVHEGIKETPFFLEYGYHLWAGPTIIKAPKQEDLNNLFTTRTQVQEMAKAALVLAAEQMKWYYN